MPVRLSDSDPDRLGFAAAREVCRRHARSFYFASFFLPAEKRDAAYAVYALCRMMDDAVDAEEPDSTAGAAPVAAADAGCATCGSSAALRLGLFRDRLTEIYDRTLRLPEPATRSEPEHVLHAFGRTVHRYAIPQSYFVDLAEGCAMDLSVSRYATWASLENYCYHVAGVVGLIMSCVFGLTHPDARDQAVQMGNAMQLTNILRDIKEDSDRGRIYLPQEDLARFGYGEKDLAGGVVNDAFRSLMRFEIGRARHLYRSGSEGLCRLGDDRSRLTAAAMGVIYAGILDAIEKQGYDVFARRAHLTTAQKLARLPAAWRLSRRQPGDSLPAAFGGAR